MMNENSRIYCLNWSDQSDQFNLDIWMCLGIRCAIFSFWIGDQKTMTIFHLDFYPWHICSSPKIQNLLLCYGSTSLKILQLCCNWNIAVCKLFSSHKYISSGPDNWRNQNTFIEVLPGCLNKWGPIQTMFANVKGQFIATLHLDPCRKWQDFLVWHTYDAKWSKIEHCSSTSIHVLMKVEKLNIFLQVKQLQ